jgi:hypothetical protein
MNLVVCYGPQNLDMMVVHVLFLSVSGMHMHCPSLYVVWLLLWPGWDRAS